MTIDEYSLTAILYDNCLTPLLKAFRTDIRTLIQHRGHRRVLDICCGTGDQLRLLESGTLELAGIDNSEAMLARARKNCGEHTTLELADATQLDFPAGHFDCAILSFALHDKHPTQRDLIFSNARKVVAQGGSLIVTDYSKDPSGFKGFLLGDILIPVVERLAGRDHYLNYLSWQRNGGIEAFLQQRSDSVDIISRRFGGSVFCCAVAIDDDIKTYQKHLALLHKSFSPSE
ncbi:MAG: class I SAM-dependent methyltransferase [Desulfofustis sp.]|nr:class I SAM-dependent methyltransferase [Desulfofustis sp.]MBT8353591.1 class I SAM-dependent methyltransferase [Desulfofustis sp.]